jgi:hypothetical protein
MMHGASPLDDDFHVVTRDAANGHWARYRLADAVDRKVVDNLPAGTIVEYKNNHPRPFINGKHQAETEFARGDQVAKLLKKKKLVASGFVDIAKSKPGKGIVGDLRSAVAKGVREIKRS